MTRRTALVTGASSGIGMEFAKLAAGDGHNLILVARSTEKLEQLGAQLVREHGVESLALTIDLAQPDGASRLGRLLEERNATVDVLINNAGFADRGTVAEIGEARQIDIIQVNVTALTALTCHLLPAMLARRRGAILNVASTAAFQPGPEMSVYYATKAFVLHFTEGLHEELLGTGVSVTCLCPGATATGFAAEAGVEQTLLFRLGTANARDVAVAGWAGLKRNKAIVIPGLKNKLSAFGYRLAPRSLVRKLAHSLQRGT